jgi:ABC-type multidrug transport system ATPase subunit
MIKIENLYYKEKDFLILKGININILEKECFAILGPNGAGKTTLIEIIISILKPTSGKVEFFGKRFEEIKEKVGVVFEDPPLFYYAKVNEMIDYLITIYSLKKHKIEELIKHLELEKIKNREIRKLSKGEKKKVSILIALMNDPEILILDEPTSGLDPFVREKLWKLFKSQERTIIFSTHIWDEAKNYANKIAFINNGEIIGIGSPSDFISEKFLRLEDVFTYLKERNESI